MTSRDEGALLNGASAGLFVFLKKQRGGRIVRLAILKAVREVPSHDVILVEQ